MALPAGFYRIKNVRSGTYVTGSADEPGTVYGWNSRPDNEYQTWELQAQLQGVLDGYGRKINDAYHIRNVGDGRYLSISGASDGARVGKATENPARWVLSEVGKTGGYSVVVDGSAWFLDLNDGRNVNGDAINLKRASDDAQGIGYSQGRKYVHETQQTWRFKRLDPKPADSPKPNTISPSQQICPQPEVHEQPALEETRFPEQGNHYAGLIPLATYSIRNVLSNGAPLNPNPYGSSEWTVQAGLKGFILKSKIFGTFLGHDGEKATSGETVTAGLQPTEWIVTRAHEGYYIRPFAHQHLLVGLSDALDGSVVLCLSGENSRSRQVWRFEVANA